jgi:hypothetical protein
MYRFFVRSSMRMPAAKNLLPDPFAEELTTESDIEPPVFSALIEHQRFSTVIKTGCNRSHLVIGTITQ